MLPKGQAYEQWITELTPHICRALNISIDDATLRTRAYIAGVTQRHEMDILVETGTTLVLIECKDHKRLPAKDLLDAYYSFVDIATAHPDKSVVAFLISSVEIASAATRFVSRAPRIIIAPFNLMRPVGLFTLAPITAAGAVLLYEFTTDDVIIHVLQVSRTPRNSENAEELALGSPEMAGSRRA
jgi:hypothetical protein